MKLIPGMDVVRAFIEISENNPGTVGVLVEVMNFIDNPEQFLIFLMQLDAKEWYGPKIWEVYKDGCKEDLKKFMLEVVR